MVGLSTAAPSTERTGSEWIDPDGRTQTATPCHIKERISIRLLVIQYAHAATPLPLASVVRKGALLDLLYQVGCDMMLPREVWGNALPGHASMSRMKTTPIFGALSTY